MTLVDQSIRDLEGKLSAMTPEQREAYWHNYWNVECPKQMHEIEMAAVAAKEALAEEMKSLDRRYR